MIKSYVINKYLGKEFLKITITISMIFLFLGFIMNLFEEINFFKDYGVNLQLPIILTLLFIPSLLHNFFPFVILLSGIWFFLKIKKTDELTAINVSGMSNFSIIAIPGLLSIVLGIFFITAINPITSALVTKYENIKGSYETDQQYLAAITENGIWIKEKDLQKNNIIRSQNLEENELIDVTIYEFDKENNFTRRIEAKSADITSTKWILKSVRIVSSEGIIISENIKKISYISIYDVKKIKTLYRNLDTISFWKIEKEMRLLEERGYSTKDIEVKLHRSLAFPFFLLSMLLLSSVFTLGTRFSENNWRYVFITIISSILIFFFNDFSSVLGKTEKLPIQISVWMPITIIFIFSAVGIIHANQK
jgi:lipopolysaccharide export system permease protein|tara:strand:+ start:1458 stop:2549 length:1092 start_codon:yes stop_codon:yes gene_type:complete